MSKFLPPELMIDIFIRLPIKSILRCTSVCKSWYSLITSPNLITMHLNRKQNDHIVIQNQSSNPEIEIYALDQDTHLEFSSEYLEFSFECSYGYFIIVGSCNGILCVITDLWNDFYFWNPSIRKSVKLPVPVYTSEKFETIAYTVGFGFDPVTNDYKVVRVVQTTLHLRPPHVDLYKLSAGVWENISPVDFSYIFYASTPQTYVNGASHWIAFKWDERSPRNVIVLFDMHDEKFSEMILPSSLTNESRQHYDEMFLFVSEESLCLVDNNYDKTKPIDIWMMREYGAPNSWVKQFSVQSNHFVQIMPLRDHIFWTPNSERSGPDELEIANEFVKPIAIRKNGEILWKANRRLLVSVGHLFKDLDISKSTNDWCHNPRYVNYYKESLVLPDKWINNCVGDALEQSSDLWNREHKDGRRRLLRAKTKKRMRIASLLHMCGLLYVSKRKGKWLRKKVRRSMQVKKHSLSN